MTENQVKKLVGKKIRIVKNVFPHSVKTETLEGIVGYDMNISKVLRDNKMIYKEHIDLLLETDERVEIIEWNKLKLITNVEVIED